MSAPRLEFLLPTLERLVCEERELLSGGDWESALEVREHFDESFSILQTVVERSGALGSDAVALLARIHHVNSENLALYTDLKRTAQVELGQLQKVSRIGGYAPVSPDAGRAPRYIDHSA